MAGEPGTENGTTGTAREVQPIRFLIVGAPKTNKLDIANDLLDELDEKLQHDDELFIHNSGLAVGLQADYRTELKIALDRVIPKGTLDRPTLYTHSLIDSLTYASLRVDRHDQYKNVSETTRITWEFTLTMIGILTHDSLRYDHIFFNEHDLSDEASLIQERQRLILNQLMLPYTILEGDRLQRVTDAATIIESYLGEKDAIS